MSQNERGITMNERGITLQTTIVTAVLALAAAAAGIVIYNAISEESSSISENAAAADLDLFSYEYLGRRIAVNDEVEAFETLHLYSRDRVGRGNSVGQRNIFTCALVGERDSADGIYKIAKIKKAASGSVVDVYSELRCGNMLYPPISIAIDSTVGIKYVSGGDRRICIITAADALECWGENSLGQLGRGEETITPYYDAGNRRSVKLVGETPVAVSTNHHNTCAITASDKVFCWGSNEFSQLGNGYVASPSSPSCMIEGESEEIECSTDPVEISELSGQGIKQLETGRDYNCALIGEPGSDATVKCWGRNIDLELGVPATEVLEDTPTPIEVPELTGVTELSEAHGHTCALIGPPGFDATAKCWGSNNADQIKRTGSSKIAPPIIPTIPGIGSSGVKKIVTYANILCIITASDVVRCKDTASYREPDTHVFVKLSEMGNTSVASVFIFNEWGAFCYVYLNDEILCTNSRQGEPLNGRFGTLSDMGLVHDSPWRN